MTTLTLAICLGAPVPEHLFPPDPVKPGAIWKQTGRWNHTGPVLVIEVEVVRVEKGVVKYRIVGHPDAALQRWPGLDWGELPVAEARRLILGSPK